ncbi:MAG TPA: hypothetical protein VK203_18815 [Nostocaceae cyanobacterium]|nr:hypothetical protein [Nostocaceae cyanobacterium]
MVITETVNLPPGDVEVIVLQTVDSTETPKRRTKIKALQNWVDQTQPVPADFDPEQAKWEYLKGKHNL